MANKGSYNGAPPKYINDFSKALASEVRILLAEVGKLRDERRQLQYEIAELMSLKSRHGAGGEYTPNWQPKRDETPPPSPPPAPAPPVDDQGAPPAKPAWRTVHKRPERKPRTKAITGAPSPAPAPAPEPPASSLPAWAQWRPNPLLSPVPQPATPGAPLPPSVGGGGGPSRSGLFGPPTPPPK